MHEKGYFLEDEREVEDGLSSLLHLEEMVEMVESSFWVLIRVEGLEKEWRIEVHLRFFSKLV